MRQGHFKVAESYILYRAHRSRLREDSHNADAEEAQQESMNHGPAGRTMVAIEAFASSCALRWI